MESSQVVGAEPEKWSGSESGWTMYIGSPIHTQTNDVYQISDPKQGGEKNSDKKAILEYFDDDESDDSLASDASSGPRSSHHELLLPCEVGEGEGEGRRRQAAKQDQHGNYSKCSSGKKVVCRKLKKRDERLGIKEEKEEELLHKADSAGSHV
ncbi:hypothetical protein CerSpe_031910 [Prunus speciosa]